jgi:hypothetical protein
MSLTSNIKDMQAEVGRLMKDVDPAAQGALAPKSWWRRAHSAAYTAVMARAETPLQRKRAAQFVRAIETLPVPAGMEWKLDSLGMRASLTEMLLNFKTTDVSREMVEKWVAEEKEKSLKETGMADEEIAANILAIIFAKERTAKLDASAQALVFGKTHTHGERGMGILDYAIAAEPELGAVDEEKLSEWLEAIADAWTEVLIEEAPEAVVAEIGRIW